MTFIGWTTKTYDSRCLDLAEVFISDNPSIDNNRAHQLAICIQNTIELWIGFEEAPCDWCHEPRGKGDHSTCILF